MNTQQKSILVGAILGAALGALGGFLFTRGLEMPREEQESGGLSLGSLPPGQVVALFIAIMGVLRGIAELGERIQP
jgi:hypothetical protein